MAKKKTAPKSDGEGQVRLDPNLPLLPGNSVSFYTPVPEDAGRLTVKITDARGPVFANVVPGGNGDLRISKIVETAGTYKVEFFNDGKKFASGEFE